MRPVKKKGKVKGHSRLTSKGVIQVSPHTRSMSVGFRATDSGKIRPDVNGLESVEDARKAAQIIKAFKEECGEDD